MITRYQTFIQTKWLGQTNHKPARVKAWVVSNPKRHVTLSWDYALSQLEMHVKVATKLYGEVDEGVTPVELLVSGVDGSGYIFTKP